MTAKKKIMISVASILTAFLLLNCVWGVYAYSYVNNYTKSFTDSKDDPMYGTLKDGVTYSATKPKYLNFLNNLAIADGNNENSLLIWIKPFSKIYGVHILVDDRQYQMYVDKDGKPTGKQNASDAQEVYQQNTETINKLMKQANDFWDLK